MDREEFEKIMRIFNDMFGQKPKQKKVIWNNIFTSPEKDGCVVFEVQTEGKDGSMGVGIPISKN